ncbi:unnamed protein product [Miscanthus lutarioriparius]|uniref:Mitochondrial inner membrane protease subunit 2 n=1 Tax=Miscanthus lutarioriparius TaxID=422564 RepID=A0A811MPL1_9POAL|nr:unnamed protein product [Miscanthus lutarioriparius]
MGDGQYTELTPFLAHLKYRRPWLSPSFLVRPSTTRARPQSEQEINGKLLNSPTESTQMEAMWELQAPWTRLLALPDDSAQEECNGGCNWRLNFRPLCDLHFGDWRIHVSYFYRRQQRLGRVLEPGDFVLAEKRCIERYKFSHGDVILFKCPSNHKQLFVKRLIGLPGEWIQIPGSLKLTKIPEGHCWVEGDNSARSWDSRAFGPIPLGLVQGRVTHIIWPPSRTGRVERKIPEGRISPD